ncbi:MAG: hypothetical protein CSA70_02795 [Rhodobacterales bacterium]|nr:MAG: hypothetical protein CSA70_02795 [Rhodobacterales bacterium]
MLIVISPAKRLNEASEPQIAGTYPQFQKEAAALVDVARGLSVGDIQKLMKLSDGLAQLNHDRFREFGSMPQQPAALMFNGDTYAGLEAATLDVDEMSWAQDHLRILSGLYGVLAPMDQIEPYRLEMGSRLANPKGRNLYEFWGDKISMALNDAARKVKTDTLINCASQEYFGAVAPEALTLRVITPVIMEMKPQGLRIVSFFAKKARGAMARYIIQRRLSNPEGIKEFDTGGYAYRADLSEGDNWVFLRDAEA